MASMTIVDLETIPVRVPLLRPFKAAYGVRESADFVLVKITADNGIVGLGEASTIPIYDEGSQGGVVYCIERYLKPLLLGRDPRRIGALHEMMNRALKGQRYAKGAIDYALYDMTARSCGVPVYQLLGGYHRPVEVSAVFSAADTEQLLQAAEDNLHRGYRVFKLKVGSDHRCDVDRVRQLREVLGYDVQLRLDGNEAWGSKEAIAKIGDFMRYLPTHVEQPVPARDIAGLNEVRQAVTVPIVIDESVVSTYDAHHVLSCVRGDLLNIKTARCGGLFPSLKVAAVAEAAGVPTFVGSMLELGIGTVAGGHFAAALTGCRGAAELVGPQFVRQDILKSDLTYDDGRLILPDGNGWGVELDEEIVRDFRCRP